MKKRLLIDDRWHSGGIKRYSDELCGRIMPHFESCGLGCKWPLHDVLSPLRLSNRIRMLRPDVFWSPGYMPPLGNQVPFVCTIHDLIHVRASGVARAAYYNLVIRPLCRRAYRVATVSRFSRDELCEWAKIAEDRVVVISNGVSAEYTADGPAAGFQYPYLLYVGAQRPHKNLGRVVEAFARSGLSRSMKFALTGTPNRELMAIAAQLGIQDSMVFVGHVAEEELPAVYRGASAVVLVSLYEGFGLPALEGMACGVPVLCSDRTSLPEVVGTAAVQVNPEDVDAIAAGMRRVVEDETLRERLVREGMARSRQFRWDDSAKQLTAVLQEAAH